MLGDRDVDKPLNNNNSETLSAWEQLGSGPQFLIILGSVSLVFMAAGIVLLSMVTCCSIEKLKREKAKAEEDKKAEAEKKPKDPDQVQNIAKDLKQDIVIKSQVQVTEENVEK